MSGKVQDYRIFVGGLSWDVTEHQLEDAFSPFGKIVNCQVMLERDTGHPRGFGFLTFADRRAMEDAIREMDGAEVGDRVISANKAQPRMEVNILTMDMVEVTYQVAGQATVRIIGTVVHVGIGLEVTMIGTWMTDMIEGTMLIGSATKADMGAVIDALDNKLQWYHNFDWKFASKPALLSGTHLVVIDRLGNRYGDSDRYPQNGYGKERGFDRDVGARAVGERYEAGGPARCEGRSYRDRAGPYDRHRRGGRPPSFDRY